MEDVTGYLFLHGHILNQQSPDTIGNSMRAFLGFPPWTKSWSAGSKTSQTDSSGGNCVLLCCCHPLGHQRKHWNFLPPIYDQSPSWLLDSCHRAIHHSSHTKQSCAPPSIPPSVRPTLGVGPTPLPEFTGIDLRPRKVWQPSKFNSHPLHHIFCIGNQRCVLLLTHYMDKRGLSVEDQ